MNEQQILANLMRDPAYRKALQALMLEDKDLARDVCPEDTHKIAYVWCVEMVDKNTQTPYYHPLVVPGQNMSMDLDAMMDTSNYTMLSAFDQFEAYDHEPMVNMYQSVYGRMYPIRLISVPEETYAKLVAALTSLVESILCEINQCFAHMDNIARMANTDATMMKMRFIGSVFGKMTTVAACFNRDMDVVDSESHDYSPPEVDDEWDDEYDDEDWDDDDDNEGPTTVVEL